MEASALQVAFTMLLNLGLAVIVGVLWARLFIPQPASDLRASSPSRLNAAMAWGLAACLLCVGMLLWLEAASMADVPLLAAGDAVWPMLSTTHVGQVGAWALAVLLSAFAIHVLLRKVGREAMRNAILMLLIAVFILLRAFTSHASVHGIFRLDALAEWLHITFMALWIGIVMVCAWLLPNAQTWPARSGDLGAALNAMSCWATIALVGIVATGLWNTNRVLTSVSDLITTPYGMVLLVKLGLVGLAIALGGYNRLIGLPAVDTAAKHGAKDLSHAVQRVMMVLRIESLLLLAVLAAAAVLTGSAPPAST